MIEGVCEQDCRLWNSCETKWYRGERGEKQVCCPIWERFYQVNSDFPLPDSTEYPQKIIEVIKESLSYERFVTAHHFAILLSPSDFLTLEKIRKAYTDPFDEPKKNIDNKVLGEALLLFQNILGKANRTAGVLINLAYLKDYSDPCDADNEIVKAITTEEPPLRHIVKFYRQLRNDKGRTDYLQRLSIVGQRISNDVLTELCKDWGEIEQLSQANNHNSVVNGLENFLSKFIDQIGAEELGKLMNRILNTASEKLEKDGDKYLCTNREYAIKCYDGSAKGYQIFTIVRPDNPVDFANLVRILDKLKNLKPEDEENTIGQLRGNSEKAINLMRAAGSIDMRAYQTIGKMYQIYGGLKRIDDKNDKYKALECFELNRIYDHYLEKGNAFMDRENFVMAKENYITCLKLNPQKPNAYAKLSMMYIKTSCYKEATTTWTKYMRLPDIKNNKNFMDWGFFQLARLCEDGGKDKIAAKLFQYIIDKRQTDHLEAHDRLATIHIKHFRWSDAIEILEKKTMLPENEPFFDYCRIGDCYTNMNNFIKVIEFYQKAEVIAPNGLPVLSRLAKFYEDRNDIDTAINYVTKIIDAIGDGVDTAGDYIWRGDLYLKKYNAKQAYQDFIKAMELNPHLEKAREKMYTLSQNFQDASTIEEQINRLESSLPSISRLFSLSSG